MNTKAADKTLETVLINIIDKLTSGVDKAIEFGSEQLPDIVQQLILFNTVQYIALVLLGPIFVFISIKYIKFIWKRSENFSRDGRDFSRAFSVTIVVLGCGGLCISSIIHMFDLIKITLAPKIWLIEYATELVK